MRVLRCASVYVPFFVHLFEPEVAQIVEPEVNLKCAKNGNCEKNNRLVRFPNHFLGCRGFSAPGGFAV